MLVLGVDLLSLSKHGSKTRDGHRMSLCRIMVGRREIAERRARIEES